MLPPKLCASLVRRAGGAGHEGREGRAPEAGDAGGLARRGDGEARHHGRVRGFGHSARGQKAC